MRRGKRVIYDNIGKGTLAVGPWGNIQKLGMHAMYEKIIFVSMTFTKHKAVNNPMFILRRNVDVCRQFMYVCFDHKENI
jgi:hypothetical protein